MMATRFLFLSLIFITFVGCQNAKYSSGDCLAFSQHHHSIFFKIENVEKENYLVQTRMGGSAWAEGRPTAMKVLDNDKLYNKVKCP